MTFRQKVEKILDCGKFEIEGDDKVFYRDSTGKGEWTTIKAVALDRILAACKEAVEGMPIMPNDGDGYCTACKEHLLKQLREG